MLYLRTLIYDNYKLCLTTKKNTIRFFTWSLRQQLLRYFFTEQRKFYLNTTTPIFGMDFFFSLKFCFAKLFVFYILFLHTTGRWLIGLKIIFCYFVLKFFILKIFWFFYIFLICIKQKRYVVRKLYYVRVLLYLLIIF